MAETYNALQHIAEILDDAKTDIKAVLTKSPQGGVLDIMIDSKLNQLINSIGHMGSGVFVQTVAPANQFPPITNFMGDDIEVRQDLREEDMNPTQDEETAYLAKVEHLENSLAGLTNADILRSYIAPDDEQVLRGVALRAQLLDYETRPIDGAFLNDLRQAVAKGKEDAANLVKADQAVKESQQKPAKGKEVKIPELSAEEKEALKADVKAPAPAVPAANVSLDDLNLDVKK